MNTADLHYCRHLYSVTYSAEQCTKHTWTTLAVSDVFITTYILQAFSVLSIAENTMNDSVIAPDQCYCTRPTIQAEHHASTWTQLDNTTSHVSCTGQVTDSSCTAIITNIFSK